jgi:hypothetical protein
MAFKIILAIVAVNRVRFARFLSRFSRETSLEESEIRSRVQTFVTALEQAGIDHSEPIPDEESVGGSGAEARFVLDVNGFPAGIMVFRHRRSMSAWEWASVSLNGVHVAFENSVLTLNSHEGRSNSVESAPVIAAWVGGTARGKGVQQNSEREIITLQIDKDVWEMISASEEREVPSFTIGSTGPGGGTVFFDAGTQQPWGRYLEVAPDGWYDQSSDPQMPWCDEDHSEMAIGGTQLGIGTGMANSVALHLQVTSSAAHVCGEYRGGGLSDWYLPSADELGALDIFSRGSSSFGALDMFSKRSGGFGSPAGSGNDNYWSSSQLNSSEDNYHAAWTVDFNYGYRGAGYKSREFLVRPIRAF